MNTYIINGDRVVVAEDSHHAEKLHRQRKGAAVIRHCINLDELDDSELAQVVARVAMLGDDVEVHDDEIELFKAHAANALRARRPDRRLVLQKEERDAVANVMRHLDLTVEDSHNVRRLRPAPAPRPQLEPEIDAEASPAPKPMSALARSVANAAKANEEAAKRAQENHDEEPPKAS